MDSSELENAEIIASSSGSRMINIQLETTTGNPQDDCRAAEEGIASASASNRGDNTALDYVAEEDDHDEENAAEMELTSLLSSSQKTSFIDNSEKKQSVQAGPRLTNRNDKRSEDKRKHKRIRSSRIHSNLESIPDDLSSSASGLLLRNGPFCCYNGSYCFYRNFRSTLQCMNFMARIVLWCTILALVVAVVWYSYELHNHGTDPHLIAWFSAGAFVLLGFPVSMWGIVGHLANYNQPSVQVYIVRILWMVPIYSIESWLAMRFHKQAIYIETLRDFYESYVLYSFLQFLIEVLGGEENLVLMLKDKSPTRGVHMWGLQWCVKPWLMGQPVRRLSGSVSSNNSPANTSELNNIPGDESSDDCSPDKASLVQVSVGASTSEGVGSMSNTRPRSSTSHSFRQSQRHRPTKRVFWKSPFFIKCKFGVLQYVLLKFLCAIAVLILEWQGLYNEGHFNWSSGYLYICILTNVSQCWALYTLIFFYYATKTELSPIRPVGKFLSVKALVFFTWWQSVLISVVYQMGMIPNYRKDWTPEDVAKGIQDYLICVEMFAAAIVHSFVFPHTEYSVDVVDARLRALNSAKPSRSGGEYVVGRKRLGRNKLHSQHFYTRYWKESQYDDSSSKNSNLTAEIKGTDNATTQEYLDSSLHHTNITPADVSIPSRTTGSWQDPLVLTSSPKVLQQYHRGCRELMQSSSSSNVYVGSEDRYTYEDKNSALVTSICDSRLDRAPPKRTKSNDVSPLNNLPTITASVREQPPSFRESILLPPTQQLVITEKSFESTKEKSCSPNEIETSMMIARKTSNHSAMYGDYSDDTEYADEDEDDYHVDRTYSYSKLEEHVSLPSGKSGSPSGRARNSVSTKISRPGFVSALLDSAIPRDLRDNTVGIVTGEYSVEKKTLLHHAATSDQYDLFSNRRRVAKQQQDNLNDRMQKR